MSLALLAAWAVCLVAYVIVRPALWSPAFWLIAAPGLAAGLAYMAVSYQEGRRMRRSAEAWLRRLESSVDTLDVEDDGHLHEWFDARQWERIFQELERMPKGQRSLRRAIATVDPSFERGVS